MSNKLPFEDDFERRMNDLPTPDQEASWQKMKKLLDEKERRKPVVIFRRLVPVAIFAMLLSLTGWYFMRTQNRIDKKPSAAITKSIFPKDAITPNAIKPSSQTTQQQSSIEKSNNVVADLQDASNNQSLDTPERITSSSTANRGINAKANSVYKNNRAVIQKTVPAPNPIPGDNNVNTNNNAAKAPLTRTINDSTNLDAASLATKNKRGTSEAPKPLLNNDTTNNISVHTDTALVNQDALKQVSPTVKKTIVNPNKKYVVSAGIGIQQQIPVGGQQVVSTGYNGKSVLTDYIPSVYLRFERNKEWFVQGEFIYSSPQLVDEFSYFRKTTTDTASRKITTYNLKKTFYSEIPVTFNYYVLPKWSVGAGGMYGWLRGAITDKQTSTQSLQSQQLNVVNQTTYTKGFTDSFMFRSHMYLLLQTDYQWRKLSLGIRYARDVQPYIKYTLPNGTIEDRRNWSLKFMARYQLWKS